MDNRNRKTGFSLELGCFATIYRKIHQGSGMLFRPGFFNINEQLKSVSIIKAWLIMTLAAKVGKCPLSDPFKFKQIFYINTYLVIKMKKNVL